jgi:dihydrofolate synthase/folylpolyglutamate synthase
VALDPLAYLFSLEQFGIKFGLDNIRVVLDAMGNPQRAFTSVHIAGTNGKGSATAIVDAALRAGGYSTGRYTSPHLLDLAERFVIDGVPVARTALIDAVARVRDGVDTLRAQARLDVHPTFFEVTTAVAFELFRSAGIEFAVCEVGLGGRLDATNVLSPAVTAITSIALDHELYLGTTLAEIAAEKAGIVKTGIPVVVGQLDPPVMAVVAAIAKQRDAAVIRADAGVFVANRRINPDGSQTFNLRTPARTYGDVSLALAGAHQVDNAVIAVRVLEELETQGVSIGRTAITEGLAKVQWPGRLERRTFADGRELLLDAAHNPAGAAALAAFLSARGTKPPLVFTAMRDKDAEGMLRALAPVVSDIVVTRASHPRSADPRALADTIRVVAPELSVLVCNTPQEAVAAAWAIAPRIVVAGSIFLLADVLKTLNGS